MDNNFTILTNQAFLFFDSEENYYDDSKLQDALYDLYCSIPTPSDYLKRIVDNLADEDCRQSTVRATILHQFLKYYHRAKGSNTSTGTAPIAKLVREYQSEEDPYEAVFVHYIDSDCLSGPQMKEKRKQLALLKRIQNLVIGHFPQDVNTREFLLMFALAMHMHVFDPYTTEKSLPEYKTYDVERNLFQDYYNVTAKDYIDNYGKGDGSQKFGAGGERLNYKDTREVAYIYYIKKMYVYSLQDRKEEFVSEVRNAYDTIITIEEKVKALLSKKSEEAAGSYVKDVEGPDMTRILASEFEAFFEKQQKNHFLEDERELVAFLASNTIIGASAASESLYHCWGKMLSKLDIEQYNLPEVDYFDSIADALRDEWNDEEGDSIDSSEDNNYTEPELSDKDRIIDVVHDYVFEKMDLEPHSVTRADYIKLAFWTLVYPKEDDDYPEIHNAKEAFETLEDMVSLRLMECGYQPLSTKLMVDDYIAYMLADYL